MGDERTIIGYRVKRTVDGQFYDREYGDFDERRVEGTLFGPSDNEHVYAYECAQRFGGCKVVRVLRVSTKALRDNFAKVAKALDEERGRRELLEQQCAEHERTIAKLRAELAERLGALA